MEKWFYKLEKNHLTNLARWFLYKIYLMSTRRIFMLKSFGKGMFGCFGVFVGFIILCILGFAFLGAGSSGSDSTSNNAKTESNSKDNTPQEYKSALNKAKLYSDTMYMSKAGIYDQLTSEHGEKFSAEAAQYAVDNLNADYNENALAKAKSYQEDMSMSPDAIKDQLTSEYGEKFTQEEADYAIQHLNE
ncbi:TPA: Ltp family lipoprotein [Enterococcus faecalis]|uniref:Ltp family lipoprotein n=1 Tax=Enterococcus faecalis TaxID=1351 RepID=UPI00229D46B7|nr:Ltp family lipoprotein [Enterococcus faecalis]HCY9019801.1 Ltp family lipoprotein [Enterococcus faecalis]HCY9020520.1 Ltp family lipoprotein [Enterococcus faecalis]